MWDINKYPVIHLQSSTIMDIQSVLQRSNICRLERDNPPLTTIQEALQNHDAVQYTTVFKLPVPQHTATKNCLTDMVSLPKKMQIVLPFPLPICNGSIITDIRCSLREDGCPPQHCNQPHRNQPQSNQPQSNQQYRVFVDFNQHHRVEVTHTNPSQDLQVPIFLMNPRHLNLVTVPQIDLPVSPTAHLNLQFQTYALSHRLYSMMSHQTVTNSYNMLFFHNSAMNGSKL